MKIVAFTSGTEPGIGILDDSTGTITTLVTSDPERGVLGVIERAESLTPAPGAPTLQLSDVVLTAPLPTPARNIMCVGKNYLEHAHEFAGSGYDSGAAQTVPEFPIVFTKAPTSVVGPDATAVASASVTREIDYEAEFLVVIGTGGKNICAEDALDHVFGYALINDLTARDLQRDHKQWFLGKSLDGFAPIGPWVATAEDIDLASTTITGTVNGELRQKASTSDLIFDVPTLIATISSMITLQPGDLIATGTPAGVGIGFTPPRFLADGDVVEVAADGLGVLKTTISVTD
jgi:2-keto-4-pentenoate hydratase/2-oxohepta-3-ene-1,7-dioic acid hydratase in catechol pathway